MSRKKPLFKKRFGQHFLRDHTVIELALSAARLQAEDRVLEVGPGNGVVTQALLGVGARVLAVEIDRDLTAKLKQKFMNHDRLRLLQEDILRMDDAHLPDINGTKYKLVSNLPYNISGPFFFWLTKRRHRFERGTLLLQEEFARRVVCAQGSKHKNKDYGSLSVIAHLCYETSFLLSVPPDSFFPPPKVHSGLIHLKPKNKICADEDAFFCFVKKLFYGRRKQLRKKLIELLPVAMGKLDPQEAKCLGVLRAEDLTPQEILSLYLRNQNEDTRLEEGKKFA